MVTGLGACRQPQPSLEELELAAGRQCGAGQDDGLEPVEQQLPQYRRQVEGHRGELGVLALGTRALDPPHGRRTACGRPQGAVEPIGRAIKSADHGPHFEQQLVTALGGFHLRQPVRHRFNLGLDLVEAGEQRVELHAEPSLPGDILVEFLRQAPLASAAAFHEAVQAEKELVRRAARVADGGEEPLANQVEAGLAEEVSTGGQLHDERGRESLPVPFEPAQQALHAAARDLGAEVRGRHVLEMMGLVEDQPLVRRQHGRFLPIVRGLPHREVGGKEMVVDHHDVRLGGPASRLEKKALIEVRTLDAGTEVRFRTNFVPDLAGRLHRQVAQRAIRGA